MSAAAEDGAPAFGAEDPARLLRRRAVVALLRGGGGGEGKGPLGRPGHDVVSTLADGLWP